MCVVLTISTKEVITEQINNQIRFLQFQHDFYQEGTKLITRENVCDQLRELMQKTPLKEPSDKNVRLEIVLVHLVNNSLRPLSSSCIR